MLTWRVSWFTFHPTISLKFKALTTSRFRFVVKKKIATLVVLLTYSFEHFMTSYCFADVDVALNARQKAHVNMWNKADICAALCSYETSTAPFSRCLQNVADISTNVHRFVQKETLEWKQITLYLLGRMYSRGGGLKRPRTVSSEKSFCVITKNLNLYQYHKNNIKKISLSLSLSLSSELFPNSLTLLAEKRTRNWRSTHKTDGENTVLIK